MVIRTAHTAMPPKPTKWRVLRPARSTRNSWKQREEKIHYFWQQEQNTLPCLVCPAPLICLWASMPAVTSVRVTLAELFPLWLLPSLIILSPMHSFSPSFCSKGRTIPVSFLLSSHNAFNARSHRPLPSPMLCPSLAACLQSRLPKPRQTRYLSP